MTGRWAFPLDPDCKVVEEYTETLYGDPMSKYAPLDDIMLNFEIKHRAECKQCQKYGAENVEVVYD